LFEQLDGKIYTKAELLNMKPLALAFVGDCVYELYIRNFLITEKYRDVNELHRKSVFYVKAKAQAYILHTLEEELTEDEQNFVRRGRNAHPHTVPKNANVIDYRYATAYEALIGYLYLSGNSERLRYILEKSVEIGRMRNESGK
jgi:ribonuclease-3 family protein